MLSKSDTIIIGNIENKIISRIQLIENDTILIASFGLNKDISDATERHITKNDCNINLT